MVAILLIIMKIQGVATPSLGSFFEQILIKKCVILILFEILCEQEILNQAKLL